jgi:hypothetical protein
MAPSVLLHKLVVKSFACEFQLDMKRSLAVSGKFCFGVSVSKFASHSMSFHAQVAIFLVSCSNISNSHM